jgi:osmotically inducible lipoprotein OsmB
MGCKFSLYLLFRLGEIMRTTHKIIASILLTSFLSGCAGMSHRQQNAAAGAAIGGVAGAVLTGGSSLGTVGGAAIGGIIGHGVDYKK